MTLFQADCYKEAIKQEIASKKDQFGQNFSYRRLAEAAKVQKTYLSKALNTDTAHLSSDQLYRASRFLNFNPEEREYLNLLHRFARTDVPEEQSELQHRIRKIQQEKRGAASSIEAPQVETSVQDMSDYFLEPMTPLIHLLLTIPRFSAKPLKVADTLGVNRDRFLKCMATLERLGLIHSSEEGVTVIRDRLHLPKNSKLFDAHREAMRQLSLQHLRNQDQEQNESMSISFTADPKTFQTIRDLIAGLLKSAQSIVTDAPAEECYQLNIDFFTWTASGR